MTSRIVDKSKNISNIEFSSVVSKDPFQYKNNSTSSLRSHANIQATMISAGMSPKSTSTSYRRSTTCQKPRVIETKNNSSNTISDVITDYNKCSVKQYKIKFQLKGTHNRNYSVVKELEDKDILNMIASK